MNPGKMCFVAGAMLISAWLAPGCQASQGDGIHSLSGSWAFHPGDDPHWADPLFDDVSWVRLNVPESWGRQGYQDTFGIAWYRIRVNPDWPSNQPLGVTIGKIDAAYELFVDGVKVGGVGQMPPTPQQEYDRHATYIVPFTSPRPSLTLALRVWRPPGMREGEAGPTGGPFEIGPLAALIERANLSEVDRLVLSCLFTVGAIYIFGLWLLRPKSLEYAWFAAVAIFAALYTFLLTQWKYVLSSDFMFLKRTEHLMLYLTAIVMIEFVWTFLGRVKPWWLRFIQLSFGAGALCVLLSPGLGVALALLPVLEVYYFSLAVIGLGFLAYWAYQGDRNALVVSVGLLAITLAMSHDAIVDRGFMPGPRFAAFGFAVLLTAMALTLAVRFHHAVEGLDQLSRELEGRVQQRTMELADAYRQMEELALRDPLTNLLNRRAVQQRASAGLSLAHRRGSSFSLALIDVDHFKSINDTHGHAAGDRVLVAVAEVLTSTARVSDDVARWGGEEFLVLLPDSDGRSAMFACERLRAAIEAVTIFDDDSVRIPVTVSVGVAGAVMSAETVPPSFAELARLADNELYRAKESGRNRICCATG
jgi:diguanylate cyclase (GGDEF)-like protein